MVIKTTLYFVFEQPKNQAILKLSNTNHNFPNSCFHHNAIGGGGDLRSNEVIGNSCPRVSTYICLQLGISRAKALLLHH